MKIVKTVLKVAGGLFALLIVIGILVPAEDQLESSTESSQVASVDIRQEDEIPIETEGPETVEVEEEVVENSSGESKQATIAKAEKSPVTETVPEPAKEDPLSPAKTYYVPYVVDGDTIHVQVGSDTQSVRLIGVDTPETVHPSKPVECFGKEASSYAKTSLEGKNVVLEFDDSQGKFDSHGRWLAYVFLEDSNFNQALISNGYAYEYTYNLPYKYQSEFKNAEESARVNKLGLWADGVCDGFGEEETFPTVTTNGTGGSKWYTSSYYRAKYYYCEDSDGWKGLSEKYLQVYDTEGDLLAVYEGRRTLHPDCL